MHETDPRKFSPILKASLYDDCNSYVPPEVDSTIKKPLTEPDEAFKNLLTSLLFVTPSSLSTRTETTKGVLSLLTSPFALAQWTGAEMGESPSG